MEPVVEKSSKKNRRDYPNQGHLATQSWPSLTYQETTGQNDCMIMVDHGAGSIEVMKCEVICYFLNLKKNNKHCITLDLPSTLAKCIRGIRMGVSVCLAAIGLGYGLYSNRLPLHSNLCFIIGLSELSTHVQ